MTDHEMKKDIMDVCKMMSERGLVGTYEGNVSYRNQERVFLTPTGQSKDLLTEDKLCTVDMEGNQIEGYLKPTSEMLLHTAAYRMRPDIGAVVHCHPPYCTAYAILNRPVELKISPEFLILFGKVPVVPYGTPGTADIYRGMDEYLRDFDVLLLANHGVVGVGKDPLEAYSKCLSLEMLLKSVYIAESVSGYKPVELSEAECAKLRKLGEGRHGAPSMAHG